MSNVSTKKPLPSIGDLAYAAYEHIESIKEFLDMVSQQSKVRDSQRGPSYRRKVEKAYKQKEGLSEFDHQELVEDFLDDFWRLREAETLAGQLSIIALYRLVELGTTKLIDLAYCYGCHRERRRRKGLYRWDKLHKYLREDFDLDLRDVQSYTKVDELRCLNNDIKHRGKVGKDLASFRGWIEGEDLFLRSLPKHFYRLAPEVPKYLEDFARRLRLKLESKLS